MRIPLSLVVVALLSCIRVAPVQGEDWPGWRGPRGDGSSHSKPPLQWNGETGKNIVWKVPTPGNGHASPIIWKDRLFLVSCKMKTRDRVLTCLDRRTGKTLWERVVFQAPLETKHALNSYASSTPVTDGKMIFVSFLEVDGRTIPAPNVGRQRPVTPGRMLVAAYDFRGNRKWIVRPGEFVSAHGYCACPVLYKNLVIVNGDHDGDSYILALDRATGKTVWKTPRKHKTRSYVTPLIRRVAGRTQLVFSGSMRVVSLNPDDGSLLWKVEGPTEQYVASMVYDGERFYMAAGYPSYHVMAIRGDGKGDVTDSHVVWHSRRVACYVPSPVVLNGFLLVADDRGTAGCFDTKSGSVLWKTRMGKHYSASLVATREHAFFVADDGRTKVVKPGPKVEVVAENPLGENTYASPAIAYDQLFLRGEKHLYCIGTRASGE